MEAMGEKKLICRSGTAKGGDALFRDFFDCLPIFFEPKTVDLADIAGGDEGIDVVVIDERHQFYVFVFGE